MPLILFTDPRKHVLIPTFQLHSKVIMTKTYAQLTREIQALQAHAEKLRHSEKKDMIARLNQSIAQYGLAAQDLRFPGTSASSSSASSSSPRSARSGASSRAATSSGGAKYSDGPGRVWGGRGPRPAWLREAIAQGRTLESFAATGKTTRGAADAPAASKVSLPPLYAHPKTGQTWSGRGPKPAWLKQGLKKRGTSIEDFRISTQASAPASSPTKAAQTPAPTQAAPVSRTDTGKTTGTAKNDTNGRASRKSLAEKVAKRTQAAPVNATQATTAAPAKKAEAAKTTRASTAEASSQAPKVKKAASNAKPSTPGTAAETSGASGTPKPASPATPVKKSNAKTDAKGGTGSKSGKNTKPPAKRAAPARKNLPASMAPSSEPAPVPPATPLPEPAPNADDSQATDSGT